MRTAWAQHYGSLVTTQAWRIDPIGTALAWVYVRPHEVDWSVPQAALDGLGYSVTEERHNLADDELATPVFGTSR